MIVRVIHDMAREGFRVVTDRARSFIQDGPAASAYFPPAVLAATSEQGDVAYFEAIQSDDGDLTFGAPSTAEAFGEV